MSEKLKIAGIYVVWNKKVLIHKRSSSAGSEASWNRFASPGGKVDPEDKGSFRTAALRELKEETGLLAKPGSLRVLLKQSSVGADSVMYYVKYTEKPVVKGPDAASKKSFDMAFDFAKKGVKGEIAGAGYFWADLGSILTFLNANPKYKNPYFVKNIKKLKQALAVADGTRRQQKQKGGGNSLEILYGTTKIAGQELNTSMTQTEPAVKVPEGHTLIMYDPDAPAGTWLHWLKGSDKTYWKYQPPSPPSGKHRYIFRLVEGDPVESEIQQSGIDPAAILPGRITGEVMFYQSAL